MLASHHEITLEIQETFPKLNENFLEEILSQASDSDLSKFVNWFKDHNGEDSQSQNIPDGLMLSPITANELTGFFDKIAKNLDTLFYENHRGDSFLSLFYKDMDLAKKRLESGKLLEPEKHLELQPSAYSGFDDKFSQQDFANILFVIAIANYACSKSQKEIDIDKFKDVLELIDEKKAEKTMETSRKPHFQANLPCPQAFICSNLALNILLFSIQLHVSNLKAINLNSNIDSAIETSQFLKNKYDQNPALLNSKLDEYNVTTTEINAMIQHQNKIIYPSQFGIAETFFRGFTDNCVGRLGNRNTNFLLFTTSLFLASEALAEVISKKNLIKTISNEDEPTSWDTISLVDGARIGLFLASQFDRRFGIDRIADNMIRGISSLGYGVINCAKSLFKSKETSSDLESGPLIDDKISPDQIKQIAKELTKLLANRSEIMHPPDPRNSSPHPQLKPSRSENASLNASSNTSSLTIN